ncbi:MAG: trypsin-like peptidase domain-containing protein [Chthonomonadaceae bacterium]|nr:trypsin-like peptidase domain-containing protein [Chthonomonadaceae bacterium]
MKDILNRPWLVIGAGALVIGGIVFAQSTRNNPTIFGGNNPIKLRAAGLDTGTDLTALKQLDHTFSSLAEAASQGVVFITGPGNEKEEGGAMTMLQGVKSGSGFVYRSDGWIVTNDHVVDGYKTVKVVLADGREVTGRVVQANDPQLDLALIKIEESGLPTLAVADSSKIRIGQIAMAIGAPFGLDDSVTFGHVSAMGRPGLIPDPSSGQTRVYSGLIQTDAAINPGNSGGPLLNVDGEVIGVNSAINSQSGSSAGIGFAIPSNVVKAVADELISTGKFDRGLMGVNPRDLKPYEMKKFNLTGGAFAEQIDSSTVAYKAGIRQGDVITAIDSQPVRGEIDLRVSMYKHSPGQTVQVTYVRGGKSSTVSVKLDAYKPEVARSKSQPVPQTPFGNDLRDRLFGQPQESEQPEVQKSGKPKLGVMVQQIDATARKQFGLPADVAGVVVTNVSDGSFASKVDLQSGDVILEVNNSKVTTVDDLTGAMSGVNWGDQVSVRFVRFVNGSRSEYTVTVPFK